MIRSTELIAANARKEFVRRKRYQNGSLQVVSTHGKRKMWILQYRDGGSKKYYTIGLYAKMSKSEAQQAQAEFMKEVNMKAATAPDPHVTFGDFLEGVALPFLRSKWKGSTRDTTENRIRHHLLAEFGQEKLARPHLKGLQAFLDVEGGNAVQKRCGPSAVGFAGDIQARDGGRLYRARPDPCPLHPERGEGRDQARHEPKGGGATHQRAAIYASALSTTWRCSPACGPARYWRCNAGTSRRIAAS